MTTTRKHVKDLKPGDVITFGGAYDVTVGAHPMTTEDGWLRIVAEHGTWTAHYRPTDTVRMATY